MSVKIGLHKHTNYNSESFQVTFCQEGYPVLCTEKYYIFGFCSGFGM